MNAVGEESRILNDFTRMFINEEDESNSDSDSEDNIIQQTSNLRHQPISLESPARSLNSTINPI